MRYCVLALLSTLLTAQQPQSSQTTVYTFGVNGQRQVDSMASRNGGGEQRVPSANGGTAPIEKVQQSVLRDDASGKVIERVVRPFDANGNPLPAMKTVVTEQTLADGSKRVETLLYRSDLNGRFSLSERTGAVTRVEGGNTVTEVQVGRPTLHGSVETIERATRTTTKTGDRTVEDTLTYRRDASGTFYAAAREVKETDKKNGRVHENTATYSADGSRKLELNGQTVSEIVPLQDGGESRQVNIYGLNAPGRPASSQPVLREQQLIEKTKTATGTVETLSIRRPAVDNPNALGPVAKISEKVCTGSCQ
jgi:hypothetical protein